MAENKKSMSKRNILDLSVAGIALIALIISLLYTGCSIDIWVSILCILFVAFGTVLLLKMNKKIEKEM